MLTFKPLPKIDGVTILHPDGLYLHDGEILKQVVMVGDNLPSPMTVASAFGEDFVFDGAYMLPATDERTEHVARARGFIAVLIRKRGSRERFPGFAREHSLEPVLRRARAYEEWDGNTAETAE